MCVQIYLLWIDIRFTWSHLWYRGNKVWNSDTKPYTLQRNVYHAWNLENKPNNFNPSRGFMTFLTEEIDSAGTQIRN